MGADGFYECPECHKHYGSPQGLGAHRYKHHGVIGVKSPNAQRRRRAEHSGEAAQMQAGVSRLRRLKRPHLSAEQICEVVLADICPDGRLSIDAIGAYLEWVDATRRFVEKAT